MLTPVSSEEKNPNGYDRDSEHKKDSDAIRRRHIMLALKHALQMGTAGGLVGAVAAGSHEGGMNGGQGAIAGLLAGALAGGTYGAAKGGVRRYLGMDPLLDTTAIARAPK